MRRRLAPMGVDPKAIRSTHGMQPQHNLGRAQFILVSERVGMRGGRYAQRRSGWATVRCWSTRRVSASAA